MTIDGPSPGEEASACTAVLVSAPQAVAQRVHTFLGRHRIPSEIRVADPDADDTPLWDVLVRPEDLPAPRDVVEIAGDEPSDLGSGAAETQASTTPEALEPVVLCELPWNEAWRLTERLIGDGIPAAVMAGEGSDRDRPMSDREVPVGVRPEDLERARAFLA